MHHRNSTIDFPAQRHSDPRTHAAAALLALGSLALSAMAQDLGRTAPIATTRATTTDAPAESERRWLPVEHGDKLGLVRTHGTGPRVMVLIPHSGHSGAVFYPSFERYAGHATMYAVTLRGNGGTEPLPGLPSEWANNMWSKLSAQGIAELLDDKDLKDVVLVGHGNGAQLAWLAAIERPDRVAGIIALDGYAFHPLDAVGVTSRREMLEQMEGRMSGGSDENNDRLRRTVTGAMVQDPSHARLLIADHMQTPRAVHRRFVLESQHLEIKPKMIELAKPALIIAALPDNANDLRLQAIRDRYRAAYGDVPGAFVEYFDQCRQFVMFDEPELLEAAVLEFMSALPGAEPADHGKPADESTDTDRKDDAPKP